MSTKYRSNHPSRSNRLLVFVLQIFNGTDLSFVRQSPSNTNGPYITQDYLRFRHTRDSETQRPRDPETQRPRDPKSQKLQSPKDPKIQRPRIPVASVPYSNGYGNFGHGNLSSTVLRYAEIMINFIQSSVNQ